jgi:hypothetical protein
VLFLLDFVNPRWDIMNADNKSEFDYNPIIEVDINFLLPVFVSITI